jgi:hypothetical protein
VIKRYVYTEAFEVRARDENEALEKVWHDGGEDVEGTFEYSHTLSSDTWTVEKQ